MIKKFNHLFCLFLLCIQLVPFSLVFAETIEDTPTSETSMPSLPAAPLKPTKASEGQKVTKESESEQPVLNYEDQQLLEQERSDSSLPAVLLEEKALNQEVVLRGRVIAGSEGQGTNRSETNMQSLILQRTKDETNWIDHHVFTVNGSGANVTKDSYGIDFSEKLEEPGNYRYRLIMDYSVDSFDEEVLLKTSEKKASSEVGSVEVLEEKTTETVQPESTVEESVESEESTEPEESVSTNESPSVEETTEESKEVKQAEENEPIAPPPMETSSSVVPTKAITSELPELQDNYRQAFQRGLGIMPMAANNPIPTQNHQNPSYSDSRFYSMGIPAFQSASYTSKTKVKMSVRVNWTYLGVSSGGEITVAEATQRINQRAYKFTVSIGGTSWSGNAIYGDLTQNHLNSVVGTSSAGKLSKLTNTRTVNVVNDGGTRRGWSNNVTQIELIDIPVATNVRYTTFFNDKSGNSGGTCGNDSTYNFSAPNITDLTAISTPVFEAIDENATTVYMKRGTYTGDVLDNVGGTFDLATTGTFWQHRNNIGHTNTRNGTYYVSQAGSTEELMGGLAAGTEYTARVGFRDVFSNWKYSGNTVIRTPNTVNTPTVSTLNTTTASFTGVYNVGAKPAHPPVNAANVRAQVKLKGANWPSTVSTLTGVTINQLNKQIGYTLSGLAPKTVYETRYAVKNTSGAWSPWSASVQFTTKGIGLTVNPPVFDQDSATSSTIQMKPGTYTGDISQTGNSGVVYTESYNNTGSGGTKDWTIKVNNLPHTKTTNGSYGNTNPPVTITGLDAGTRYRGWVRLMDYEGNLSPFVESDPQYFYTTNAVAKPSVVTLTPPTTLLNAKATLSGQYTVGTISGQTPTHPDQMKVRISLDDGNWTEISSTTTPKLSSSAINTGTTAANFSLENLKANTQYFVQYCVKNQGGWSEWSASEDFTTAAPPAGIYLLEHPTLDFGMLEKELFSQTANLSTDSIKNHVVIDNTLTSSGWALSAKLENLARITDAQVMPWATLRMDINLQNTTDNGGSWNNYTTGVIGVPRTLTLNAGDPAQNLWSISNAADAQGTFRNEIDWTSVELEVPANQEGYYQGKLVWSLDSIP